MHLPTRRQERAAAGSIAVIVMVIGVILAVLINVQLGAWILFMGTLAVIAFIGVTNWLISRSRNGG